MSWFIALSIFVILYVLPRKGNLNTSLHLVHGKVQCQIMTKYSFLFIKLEIELKGLPNFCSLSHTGLCTHRMACERIKELWVSMYFIIHIYENKIMKHIVFKRNRRFVKKNRGEFDQSTLYALWK
jgi:hypothetical protein